MIKIKIKLLEYDHKIGEKSQTVLFFPVLYVIIITLFEERSVGFESVFFLGGGGGGRRVVLWLRMRKISLPRRRQPK